jgi:hypothetical protein
MNNPLKYTDPSGFLYSLTAQIVANEEQAAAENHELDAIEANWNQSLNNVDAFDAMTYMLIGMDVNSDGTQPLGGGTSNTGNTSTPADGPSTPEQIAAVLGQGSANNYQQQSAILGSNLVNAATCPLPTLPDLNDVLTEMPNLLLDDAYQFVNYTFSEDPGAMGFGGPEQGMSCSGLLCRVGGFYTAGAEGTYSQTWATCYPSAENAPPGFSNITNSLNTSSATAFYSGMDVGDVMVYSPCNNPSDNANHTIFFNGYSNSGTPQGWAAWTSGGVGNEGISDWPGASGVGGGWPQVYEQTNVLNFWNNFWNTYGKW